MNKVQKYEIINRLARGETSVSIASDTGVAGSTIRAIKKNNQKLVQEQADRLVKYLPDILEEINSDIKLSKKVSTKIGTEFEDYEPAELIQLKKVCNKTLDNVMQSVGIYSSRNTNFINNLQVNNDNSSIKINSILMDKLGDNVMESIDNIHD